MDALRLRVGARFAVRSPQEIAAVFVVRPQPYGRQRLLGERWQSAPDVAFHDYADAYGNVRRRVTLPQGPYDLAYEAQIAMPPDLDAVAPDAVERTVAELPDDILVFTLPSRYCLSNTLSPKAQELFGGIAPGWGRVQAICDFVNGHLVFGYGASTPATTALDAFENARGVCRDYAHLAIAFAARSTFRLA